MSYQILNKKKVLAKTLTPFIYAFKGRNVENVRMIVREWESKEEEAKQESVPVIG